MAFALNSFRLCCRINNGILSNIRFKRLFSSVPKTSTISDVYSSEQLGRIQIEGWITGVRKMKDLLFIDLTDGSCAKKLQITVEKNKAPKGLNFGASVKALGLLQTNKNNQVEVLVDKIDLIGECNLNNGYPFTQRMPYNPNHEREFIHLRPRTSTFSSLLRIRHKSQLMLHNILDSEGFFNIDVPVLTTNDCEGGGEVFIVKPDNNNLIKEMIKDCDSKEKRDEKEIFFDRKTYLTVSGQLHLEAASRALKKVYSFGPIFRAENSKSRLHLSEFYMLETEIAFINDINDIANIVENLLKNFVDKILSNHSEELHSYYKSTSVNCDEHLEVLSRIVNEKFITLTYDEAFNILDKNHSKFKSSPRKGESFGKEHELYLVECCDNVPVFIVDWPEECKPFYMKSLNGNSNKVEALDLLCMNVGELCGGGVREDDHEKLKAKIERSNFGSKLDWYLQLREFGNVTTGGFGMGFERFLQLILGTSNIKDTIPFPRWPHNCKL